jgi:hypothetical protein
MRYPTIKKSNNHEKKRGHELHALVCQGCTRVSGGHCLVSFAIGYRNSPSADGMTEDHTCNSSASPGGTSSRWPTSTPPALRWNAGPDPRLSRRSTLTVSRTGYENSAVAPLATSSVGPFNKRSSVVDRPRRKIYRCSPYSQKNHPQHRHPQAFPVPIAGFPRHHPRGIRIIPASPGSRVGSMLA